MIICSEKIKNAALELGFDACGISKASIVESNHKEAFVKWLDNSYQADMSYMANNFDKRCDPRLLTENTKSVISIALNYYPQKKQPADAPQFAYYAYGIDYHDVVKHKLQLLLDYIKSIEPEAEGRVFCDTAPILERYWAVKSGIGFIGKNSMLIIPKRGSFFFLGQIFVNIELDNDNPIDINCGNCHKCIDACPTGAIVENHTIDARKCISYHTIENKGEISSNIAKKMSNCIYGCDICQKACPWNRFSVPHTTPEFNPSDDFMAQSHESLLKMDIEEYRRTYKGSAIKRVKFDGLKRNLSILLRNKL